MQGFSTIQTINPNENFLFMGNCMKAPIEGVGTYRLIMDTGHHLDLFQTLYVPSVSRYLISFSRLDVYGFSVKFEHGCFIKNTTLICSGILTDGLYKLKLDNIIANPYSLFIMLELIVVYKNENSTFL